MKEGEFQSVRRAVSNFLVASILRGGMSYLSAMT